MGPLWIGGPLGYVKATGVRVWSHVERVCVERNNAKIDFNIAIKITAFVLFNYSFTLMHMSSNRTTCPCLLKSYDFFQEMIITD